MKTAILAITDQAKRLAKRLEEGLEEANTINEPSPISEIVRRIWTSYDCIIFIMAAGIAVRAICPHIRDKFTDPCVVVMDEKGHYAISLLSGHIGGGNRLARKAAEVLGGQAVITTASDILGLPAIDLWARDLGLVPENRHTLARVSAVLVNTGSIRIYSDIRLPEPEPGFVYTSRPSDAEILISNRTGLKPKKDSLILRPKNLAIGIGCNKGASEDKIAAAVKKTLEINSLSPLSIRNLASIDLKMNEEGLITYAKTLDVEIKFYTKELLNTINITEPSKAVMDAVGAGGVCEPSAVISAGTGRLLVRKTKWKDVTVAVAEADFT